jgi:hypothetical protein
VKAGSFFPGAHYSSLYAMAGDDCSLHFDLDRLTEKQQADHLSNVELTAMLQVALALIGHGRDHLALYDEYQKPEWQNYLTQYQDMFSRMVGDTIPMTQFSYHPKHSFYESVAALIAEQPDLTDVVNLYMSSGSNFVIHQNKFLLDVNRNVNSKTHFADYAPGFGIPVPDTIVVTKADISGAEVSAFFVKHQNQVIAKLLGLAGARNVTAVDSIDDCRVFVEEYDDDMVLLLQKKLPLDFYTEMTVDLFIADDDIHIANTRKLLFAAGLWVGNLIGDSVSLTADQQVLLLKVGEYARSHGYTSNIGSNCGIDFFVGNDGSIVVTEINARWTGGLFPAEVLKQIDTGGRDAVPFFDMVRKDKREAYIDFVSRYLAAEFDGKFSIAPLGIGCFEVPVDGEAYYYTWQIVLGDFEAFKQAKQSELGDGAMPTADIINLN